MMDRYWPPGQLPYSSTSSTSSASASSASYYIAVIIFCLSLSLSLSLSVTPRKEGKEIGFGKNSKEKCPFWDNHAGRK